MTHEAGVPQSTISNDLARTATGGTAPLLRYVAIIIVNAFIAILWLGLFAWLIGRVVTDRFEWSQWLWWIPTPAALIAAAIGWLLAFRSARTRGRRRRRIATWSMTLVLMLAHFSVFEHRLLHGTPEAPARALTIAHWNMTLDNNADVPALMKRLDELDADLISLTTPPGEVRRLLHEQAAASEGRLTVVEGWPMTFVSRLPILEVRTVISIERSYMTRVEVDATATLGRAISIMLVDLPSNPGVRRMETARKFRGLLDEMRLAAPDIAIGDFNMTRNSASIATLFPGMTFAYNQAGHGYGATFPRRLPLYHIDHTLINEKAGLQALRYDIRDEGQSRHRSQKAWIDVVSTPAG